MKKILVVDDDFVQRDLYAELFTAAGFEVVIADDGQEAWEKATTFRPDLLFTGIDMPRMTGFELVENFRNDRLLNAVPAIIFSHLGRESDRKRASMLPNVYFVVKGYNGPSDLLRYVRDRLERKEPGFYTPHPLYADDDDRPPAITF